MRLLLDTHAFLWWETEHARLSADQHAAISSITNQVYVSAVSAWEIAIKRASGKLSFRGSVARAIEKHRFTGLPISVEHTEKAGSLPQFHRDPFDRLLVAQAQLEGLVIVTADPLIFRYQVPHL